MIDDSEEISLLPFDCLVCDFRRMCRSQSATAVHINISVFRHAICARCEAWLAQQTGTLSGGALDLEKSLNAR